MDTLQGMGKALRKQPARVLPRLHASQLAVPSQSPAKGQQLPVDSCRRLQMPRTRRLMARSGCARARVRGRSRRALRHGECAPGCLVWWWLLTLGPTPFGPC